MGRSGVGQPRRGDLQRHQRNIAFVRRLVDAGSPDLVRDAMVGGSISGARRKYPLPSIGHRSGKLRVVGYIRGVRGGVSAIVVDCDCGCGEYAVDVHNFRDFRSTRCPVCAKSAAAKKRFWKYSEALPNDEHRTRLLNRLSAQITRCHNPNDVGFPHYGGRGIKVCELWRADRSEFLRYAQSLEGWDNPKLDIDRIDVDGNYEPGNIRFVSRSENARNKRKITDLEARIRHLELRLKESIHGSDEPRPSDRP